MNLLEPIVSIGKDVKKIIIGVDETEKKKYADTGKILQEQQTKPWYDAPAQAIGSDMSKTLFLLLGGTLMLLVLKD